MFFTIIFSIYIVINTYIFIRGWQAVPAVLAWRLTYVGVFLFVFLAFILGRVVEHRRDTFGSEILIWVGAFWLAAMLYFVLACAVLDIARVVNHFLPFFPKAVAADYPRAKVVTLVVSVATVGLLVLAGHVNTYFIRTRTLVFDVPKEVSGPRTLRIAFASDIHLGGIIGDSRLRTIVGKINALAPDLIILGGDIVDEDLSAVSGRHVGDALSDLRAPLGVIGVIGNHEHIGGLAPAIEFLTTHNVRLLRDEVIKVRDDIYIVGREDSHHGRTVRRPLPELMAQVDTRFPVIVVNHEPRDLAETAALGADVELSGHAHNGQLWPWNYLVLAFYDVKYGYRRIGNMQVYVTSGAAT